ncbi:GT-D fold domain-containing glycosyltransferase [Arthrobacter pigmenti]
MVRPRRGRGVQRPGRAVQRAASAGPSGQDDRSATESLLRDIRWELQQQRRYLEIQRLHTTGPILDEAQAFTEARQMSFRETLVNIARDGLSFARFGDGELRMMLRAEYSVKFQRNNPDLRQDLRDVLTAGDNDDASLLVGFPQIFRDMHWSGVWADLWPQLSGILPPAVVFGNSQVSRPFFFSHLGDEGVELWRRIWDGLNVCIITGTGSRFELVDELFDNVASVSFIHTVPAQAHTELPDLLRRVKTESTADLHLIALGPAGTVLAAQLARIGRRAIDVGHVSDGYLHARKGGAWPESKPVVVPAPLA